MKKKNNIYSVTTITPHRISFVGGGSDYSDYYRQKEGSVINSTINKYLFVTVKKHSAIYPEKYRLMYSKTEFCNSLANIKNNIARECLRLLPVETPITITTNSDLPPDSGAGSSSAFAVGLLNALHHFRGEKPSCVQLAKEACKVEIDILKKNSGKQDQYAAAFGGFNKFTFKKDEQVIIEPLNISNKNINKIFKNLCLIWTGVTRNSSKIVKDYKLKSSNTSKTLDKLMNYIDPFQKSIENKNINLKLISNLIEQTWKIKKNISKKISNDKIEKISKTLYKNKINGHRIIGAGGGGFILCITDSNKKKKLINRLNKTINLEIKFEPAGSQLLSILYNQ
jgi:D-glycero-alpha-D-manno-heptose-7-phosphate kinase